MNQLTPAERDQLLENGRLQRAAQNAGQPEHDFSPVGDNNSGAVVEPPQAGPVGARAWEARVTSSPLSATPPGC